MTDLLSSARRLAEAQPAAQLPCPLCASSVKGANLAGHLAKVHAGVTSSSGALSWRGADKHGFTSAFMAALVVSLPTAAIAFPLHHDAALITALVGTLAWSAAFMASIFNLLPARVTLTSDGLVFRYAFGLLRRRTTLPSAMEVGSLKEGRSSSVSGNHEYNAPSTYVSAGAYVRFAGPSTITIGCPSHTGFKDHWSGWTQGPQRKSWDITLPRSSFVELQYALYARDLLAAAA